jgi:hypothetical protein
MQVNNGGYRRTQFVFEKIINGLPVFTGGFPVNVSILDGFAEVPAITEAQFVLLSDAQYQARLSQFYSYLALQYPFFDPLVHIPPLSEPLVNSHGTDTASCPLDIPLFIRKKLNLHVTYSTVSQEEFAEIYVSITNLDGSPSIAGSDIPFQFLLKEQFGNALDWQGIESTLINATIPQGQSSMVLVSLFKYRSETDSDIKSVKVRLLPFDDDSLVSTGDPDTVIVAHTDSSFLFNHISNLEQAYQDMLSDSALRSAAVNGDGLMLSAKTNRSFHFDADQPRRPVFMYPKSWGILSAVRFVQQNNINILFDGAFMFNNGVPYEVTLTINNENIQYYVYPSKAMIIYPYPVEYRYFFE